MINCNIAHCALINVVQVSRADIEEYIGESELPPYCEMTLKATTGVKNKHEDLAFVATIDCKNIKKSIMINQTYEP